jgi:hypothetical protein
MSISLFGSCRISKIEGSNNLNNLLTYTHNTKETIQLLLYIKGELEIPFPYNKLCFRTALCNNSHIEYHDYYRELFDKSNICVVEICSLKKYIHNNFLLHHLSVDKRYKKYKNTESKILNEFHVEEQNKEEIEQDILKIKSMIYPKHLIIVSHYNAKLNNRFLPSRERLINYLENICEKHHISFVNPTNILKEFKQNDILKQDLGHYTSKGYNIITDYLNNCCKKLNPSH